jgi:hypothetical protein
MVAWVANLRRQDSRRASSEARKSPNSIGRYFGPDAARRAEVGNARLGGDARAREGDDARRLGDHALELVDLCHSLLAAGATCRH